MALMHIGLVAGRGRYPLRFCEVASAVGVKVFAVAFHGETDASIVQLVETVEWLFVGQLQKTIRFFKKTGIDKVIFAGQIKPSRLFDGLHPDLRLLLLMRRLKVRNASSIFSALAMEFFKDGIKVLPATTFLESDLAEEGILGKITPSKRQRHDIVFASHIVRESSRLNIGQTIVVKRGTVLAVEAFEGTDKAIQRGGYWGQGGVTVVKVAKKNQDMRFDVPCIGLRTVESLQDASAVALAVEARKTLFINKDLVVQALNKARIAVVGIALPK